VVDPHPRPVRGPPSLVGVSEEQGYDDELLPDQTTDDTDLGWGEQHLIARCAAMEPLATGQQVYITVEPRHVVVLAA